MLGCQKSFTQAGIGVTVGVGRGVCVGVEVGVAVGVTVGVGVMVAKRLGKAAKPFLPSHSNAPMTPKIKTAARIPYERKLFPVFLISGCAMGAASCTGSSLNLLSTNKSKTVLPHTLHCP